MKINRGIARAIKKHISRPLTYLVQKIVGDYRVTENDLTLITEDGLERVSEDYVDPNMYRLTEDEDIRLGESGSERIVES